MRLDIRFVPRACIKISPASQQKEKPCLFGTLVIVKAISLSLSNPPAISSQVEEEQGCPAPKCE